MNLSEEKHTSTMGTFRAGASLVATFAGLFIILVGLKYAVELVGLIFDILKNPSELQAVLEQLAVSIGGNAFDLAIGQRNIPLANIIALMVYCCGALILTWLTIALIRTGARIVSWTSGDQEAVRQILQYAFGDTLRPKEKPDPSADSKDTQRHSG